MLSIIIPTYNSAMGLQRTIHSLIPPPYAREIIVSDGGSIDNTLDIAANLQTRILQSAKGRGSQMKAGAEIALGDWLLFLHSDTVLPADWGRHVCAFVAEKGAKKHAGYFTFTLDDDRPQARRLEKIVAWRCHFLGLPYGDQGLLISRELYDQVGGFHDIPLMEDVDIVRRIGKRRLIQLPILAVTSATRYQKYGYVKRIMRNVTCLSLYFLGVSPEKIMKLYE